MREHAERQERRKEGGEKDKSWRREPTRMRKKKKGESERMRVKTRENNEAISGNMKNYGGMHA